VVALAQANSYIIQVKKELNMQATLMGDMSGTLIYAVLGTVIFILVFMIIEAVTKFSIKKQVVEDGNIAVAIVLAAFIASLGMIISAAIH